MSRSSSRHLRWMGSATQTFSLLPNSSKEMAAHTHTHTTLMSGVPFISGDKDPPGAKSPATLYRSFLYSLRAWRNHQVFFFFFLCGVTFHSGWLAKFWECRLQDILINQLFFLYFFFYYRNWRKKKEKNSVWDLEMKTLKSCRFHPFLIASLTPEEERIETGCESTQIRRARSSFWWRKKKKTNKDSQREERKWKASKWKKNPASKLPWILCILETRSLRR